MNNKKILFSLIACGALAVTSCGKKSSGDGSTAGSGSGGGTSVTCPAGFVQVPALAPYTTTNFCVAKYEMKNDGDGNAVSQAAGTPWESIDRPTAIGKCQAMGGGYDMITNEQWQTIARNIAGTASNWSTGAVANGELNRGISDGSQSSGRAASADDINGNCENTGQTCSSTTWNSQRRTHTLSNGSVVWDIAGNVWEWVSNDNNAPVGTDDFVSSLSGGDARQTNYGATTETICATPGSSSYCGMGYAWISSDAGAVLRGGDWSVGVYSGVFASDLNGAPTATSAYLGFRCVFVP